MVLSNFLVVFTGLLSSIGRLGCCAREGSRRPSHTGLLSIVAVRKLGVVLVEAPRGYVLMKSAVDWKPQHADSGTYNHLSLRSLDLRNVAARIDRLRWRQRPESWRFGGRYLVASERRRESALFGLAQPYGRHAAVHLVRGTAFTERSEP